MKKIKVGIIGAGRIGYVHAKGVSYHVPQAEVKAIADPYLSDEARAWAAELGIPVVSTEPEDILNDGEIEAVLICSSTDTHARFTQEAARKGKHIFCEKPIDMDVERIRETLDIVEECGVKMQIGFNRRFDHNFSCLRDAVVDGLVGEPHIIRITSRDPQPPPIDYVKKSGGLFMDMMIHDFDMMRFLSGAEVEEVSTYGGVMVDPAIGEAGDIDTAVVSMKLSNGALGVIENSRKAVYGYDQRAEVFGSGGAMANGNDGPHTAVLSDVSGVHAQKPYHFFLQRYTESYAEELRQFLTAVAEDKPVPVGGKDGLYPVLIGQAALQSLREGRPVKVKYDLD